MSKNIGANARGVPWDETCWKAGAACRRSGGLPVNNPWTPGTHAFESWRTGFEAEHQRLDAGAEGMEEGRFVLQHEHKCPGCKLTFACRGSACENKGQDKKEFQGDGDVYCEFCWSTFSD